MFSRSLSSLFIYAFRLLCIALLHSIPDSRPASMHVYIYICLFLRFCIACLLTCMFLRLSIVLIHFHGTNVIFLFYFRSLRSNCSFRKPTATQALSDEASLSRADPRAMKMIFSECFSSIRLLSPFVADHETRHQMSLLFRWQYFCQFVSIGAGAFFDIILPCSFFTWRFLSPWCP